MAKATAHARHTAPGRRSLERTTEELPHPFVRGTQTAVQVVQAAAEEGQLDLGPLDVHDLADHVVEAHAEHLLGLDRHQLVADLELAGLYRSTVVGERRHEPPAGLGVVLFEYD